MICELKLVDQVVPLERASLGRASGCSNMPN